MSNTEVKFVFTGFRAPSDFEAFANERLQAVIGTGPFGTTGTAEIEFSSQGYKTVIKLAGGGGVFHGTSMDSDLEKSLQRCLGTVRSKTFKWRKDKLARKNKPRELSAAEKADPFERMKKKVFTG